MMLLLCESWTTKKTNRHTDSIQISHGFSVTRIKKVEVMKYTTSQKYKNTVIDFYTGIL